MAKRKSSADAAADYAAKDYYIAQRTDLLKNAFNAGASWFYHNQWHDMYEEAPPKSGQYLVIYLMNNGEKLVQVYDILVYCKEDEEEGLIPWGLGEEHLYLANAITHWAHIPKPPAIQATEDGMYLGKSQPYNPEMHRRDYNNLSKGYIDETNSIQVGKNK